MWIFIPGNFISGVEQNHSQNHCDRIEELQFMKNDYEATKSKKNNWKFTTDKSNLADTKIGIYAYTLSIYIIYFIYRNK